MYVLSITSPYCIEIHKLPCYDVIGNSIYEPSPSFAGLIESKLGNDEANPYWYGFAFFYLHIEKCVQEGGELKVNQYKEV